ncbi:MAG: ribonuclease P protein component [Candidatus Moraniibacteriota bacterium]
MSELRPLSAKEDFERVFRYGKALFLGDLSLKYAKTLPGQKAIRRFSFGKSKVFLASDRNRLRRTLIGALERSQNPLFTQYDMIFYAPKKLSKKPKIDPEALILALGDVLARQK